MPCGFDDGSETRFRPNIAVLRKHVGTQGTAACPSESTALFEPSGMLCSPHPVEMKRDIIKGNVNGIPLMLLNQTTKVSPT